MSFAVHKRKMVEFQRGLDESRQTHPTSETISTSSSHITSIWINAAGGAKKGRVYGIEAQPSLCHPSLLLSGASTSPSPKEMEAMQRQIAELIERLQSSEANFAKLQNFMEKHMAKSDDSEEGPTLVKSRLCYCCLNSFY